MLKKMLVFLFAFAVAGTCHSYAEDWQYLGEFTLPLDYNYARDPLILNHMEVIGILRCITVIAMQEIKASLMNM